MSFRISENMEPLGAIRVLGQNKDHYDKSIQQLASGKRIVETADDAAGLAISENMRKDIVSMRQAIRNATDGISMLQIAEGGLSSLSGLLIRCRELAMQSASDTVGDLERTFINAEVEELRQEIDHVSQRTEYNGLKLLSGEVPEIDIQIGKDHNALHRMTIPSWGLDCSVKGLGLQDMDVLSKTHAQNLLAKIDNAIVIVSKSRAMLGAQQNRLEKSNSELGGSLVNLEESKSRVVDADYALKASDLKMDQIKTMASIETLRQSNMRNGLVLNLIK